MGRAITDNIIISHKCLHAIKSIRSGREGVVALKLDMSKAYGRVEWIFLEMTMLCLGFHAIVRRYFTSFSITANSPPISHILFVDDSLVFLQADPMECFIVKKILREHEVASGQCVNFEKSAMCFHPNII